MSGKNLVFVTVLAFCLLSDQLTKIWVHANLEVSVDEIDIVPGWFSIVHARNTGAAFSTMEGQRGLFLVFTAIAIVVIVDLVRRLDRESQFVPASLGMILAGAVGNGLDRLRLGYVVDFLKVYAGHDPLKSWFQDQFGTHVWPIFNLADSQLLVGVALFVLYWAVARDSEVPDDESTPEIA